MTTEEQLAIAVETLRRLADKENMDAAAKSASQCGSGGAYMAYEDVRKFAAETLAKLAGGIAPSAPADGLCDAMLGDVKCKDPWMHGGDWHYGGSGVCWRR